MGSGTDEWSFAVGPGKPRDRHCGGPDASDPGTPASQTHHRFKVNARKCHR